MPAVELPPPAPSLGVPGWLRRNLVGSWWNTLLTLVAAWVLYQAAVPLVRWAVWDAALGATPQSCAGVKGACWSFLVDTLGLFMVGTYPVAERWRPLVAAGVLAALAAACGVPALRRRRLLHVAWALYPVAAFVLIRGSAWLGLPVVETAAWGGLMLTLMLSVSGIGGAFPIGILLALGRRSSRLPVVRVLCVAFIELMRGVPLISVLFVASVMVPLFVPAGVDVDKLLRAQIGIILFQSAYLAEVVRGGLQAIPRGQTEAAAALGLSYRHTMAWVVLPQALRIVIPSLVNQFIIILKDTSLVVVVGLLDLLAVAEIAMRNPKWLGRTFEAYAFVGVCYWVMCYSISRYSLRLEARFKSHRA